MKQKVDNLSVRSVDGSESTSSNWELELQASMEKLNNLPYKVCESDKTEIVNNSDTKTADVTNSKEDSGNVVPNEKVLKNDKNDRRKQLDDIYQGWQSLTQSPINSIINRSKLALKNSLSKSLSNSPVNMGSFSFGKSKSQDTQGTSGVQNSHPINENKAIENSTRESITNREQSEASSHKIEIEKVNTQGISREIPSTSVALPARTASPVRPSQLSVDDTQVQKVSKATHSLDSTPVRVKPLSSSTFAYSLNDNLSGAGDKLRSVQSSDSSSSKAKELPLLSFFQKSNQALRPTKDKSCSMINLNEKQNLKTLLDKSSLGNIQAVSVEKLANARHKLVGDS